MTLGLMTLSPTTLSPSDTEPDKAGPDEDPENSAWGRPGLSDDELVGLVRAWRRLASWATAGELAAVSELAERRRAAVAGGAGRDLLEHLGDEVAAALTLTARSADRVLELACALARLPRTRAALARGDIDQARAAVIADELSGLGDAAAADVEDQVIWGAPGQTTGQLRAAARRAVLAADPDAAARRRERAQRNARVEAWPERSGTAALAGRDLPPAEVLAADNRINALACGLKADGAAGTMDQIRARVYVALLLGQPVQTLRPAPATTAEPASHSQADPGLAGPGPADPGLAGPGPADPGPAGPGLAGPGLAGPGLAGPRLAGGGPGGDRLAGGVPGGLRGLGGLGGSVNLTMPLASWLGGAAPGEIAGYGPADASTCRTLATALAASQRPSRWCLTLTDPAGQAIAHGCARRPPAAPGTSGWELTIKLTSLSTSCAHPHQTPRYRPSPTLRHLVEIQQPACSFPGCRRPAHHCDLDHTTPYHQGGPTCTCNLAPLCRRHHRAKQAHGWQLQQPQPAVMIWTLPHGRSYRTTPDRYPT